MKKKKPKNQTINVQSSNSIMYGSNSQYIPKPKNYRKSRIQLTQKSSLRNSGSHDHT
jgi:hypothetical protein